MSHMIQLKQEVCWYSYLHDLMPIWPSKVSELFALLVTWHNPRSNPRGISPIGHLGDTSRQQPHQTMAGAHTGICACYVMFLYSHNFIFVFLNSASATGGSPISPWQEQLHLAHAQANASLCRWAAKVRHLHLCLFLRLTWLCTRAACVYVTNWCPSYFTGLLTGTAYWTADWSWLLYAYCDS